MCSPGKDLPCRSSEAPKRRRSLTGSSEQQAALPAQSSAPTQAGQTRQQETSKLIIPAQNAAAPSGQHDGPNNKKGQGQPGSRADKGTEKSWAGLIAGLTFPQPDMAPPLRGGAADSASDVPARPQPSQAPSAAVAAPERRPVADAAAAAQGEVARAIDDGDADAAPPAAAAAHLPRSGIAHQGTGGQQVAASGENVYLLPEG